SENVPAGWTLTGINCSVVNPNGGTQNVSGSTVTISLKEGEDVTCTYHDRQPALSLTKSANPTTYSSVGTVITYTYQITNSGSTTLAGPFSISDDKQGSISPCGTGPLAAGASTSCTSTHTITLADIDAGSITNVATASGNGVTSNQATATVTAVV